MKFFGLFGVSGLWCKELNPRCLTWSFLRKGMVIAWDFLEEIKSLVTGKHELERRDETKIFSLLGFSDSENFDAGVGLVVHFFSIFRLKIQLFRLILLKKKAFCILEEKWFWTSRLINNIITCWKSRKISILMQSSKSLVFEVWIKFFFINVWFLVETLMERKGLVVTAKLDFKCWQNWLKLAFFWSFALIEF